MFTEKGGKRIENRSRIQCKTIHINTTTNNSNGSSYSSSIKLQIFMNEISINE